jgi:hypothetical protein
MSVLGKYEDITYGCRYKYDVATSRANNNYIRIKLICGCCQNEDRELQGEGQG